MMNGMIASENISRRALPENPRMSGYNLFMDDNPSSDDGIEDMRGSGGSINSDLNFGVWNSQNSNYHF